MSTLKTGALRTPDECFENLDGFDFAPNYIEIDGLRVHYLDEGPKDADPVLLMHGEPSWCYLYRKMIPGLVAAGHRCIAPDLIGFGRSDKLDNRNDYSYQFFVDIMTKFNEVVGLENITLFCQDWGGLIGLRVLAENPERYARAVIANTGLPTGDHAPSDAFKAWLEYSQTAEEFPVGGIVNGGCASTLTPEIVAAYDAPFPEDKYKEGARIFPSFVPISPDNPAVEANKKAWEVLMKFDKPVLTAFSDGDPVTKGGDKPFQTLVPGAKGQPHTTIEGAGHFLQEDKGEELATLVAEFIANNPR